MSKRCQRELWRIMLATMRSAPLIAALFANSGLEIVGSSKNRERNLGSVLENSTLRCAPWQTV